MTIVFSSDLDKKYIQVLIIKITEVRAININELLSFLV